MARPPARGSGKQASSSERGLGRGGGKDFSTFFLREDLTTTTAPQALEIVKQRSQFAEFANLTAMVESVLFIVRRVAWGVFVRSPLIVAFRVSQHATQQRRKLLQLSQ